MRTMQEGILTAGDVARICKVAPRTAQKWIDCGYLPGYRIPGGRERRVTYEAFEEFIRKKGLPENWRWLAAKVRVLLVGFEHRPEALAIAKGAIESSVPHSAVRSAVSPFEAGVIAAQWRPTAAIVNTDIGRIEESVVRDGLAAHCKGCRVTSTSAHDRDLGPLAVAAAGAKEINE